MLGSKNIAYIIMAMRDIVFSMNIAGGDVVVHGVWPITFNAAHPILRRATTCHVWTLLPGREGVRS